MTDSPFGVMCILVHYSSLCAKSESPEKSKAKVGLCGREVNVAKWESAFAKKGGMRDPK
jgi:hypothetical protein